MSWSIIIVSQLLGLENFTKAVKNLNNQATHHIDQDQPKEALIQLQ